MGAKDFTNSSAFGLTGGIATGKSTVARFMVARGVGMIDADQLSREAVRPGTEGWKQIVRQFGRGILRPDETLDRKALGALVFSDPDKRKRLEAILHPVIDQMAESRADELRKKGYRLVGYEAAVLIEAGLHQKYRPLVVVTCPVDIQIRRLMRRDGLTEEQARQRLSAQMPLEQKRRFADFLIDTSGSLEEVSRRTDEVVRELLDYYGLPADAVRRDAD